VNVSVAYLIGRETRPPAERVRERLALAMMSHDGIMSIQTAHLSLSLCMDVSVLVYKRLVSLFPFENRGGHGEREGGKK
jgi:hypothetical protein